VNDYAKLGPAKKDYAILPTNISVEPLALGLKKGEKGLKTLVDGMLRDLESSGEADKLFVKWYGPATKLQFDKRSFKIDNDKL
jgi:polar amino acid transport system substrate-binding protein